MEGCSAIDVTGLSSRQIEQIERAPTMMQVGADGIGHPVVSSHGKGRQTVVRVKLNERNKRLVDRFGERIFTDGGKVNYKAFPADELLKRMVRRKGDSRENMFEQLGKKYMAKLLDKIPKSELKLDTKKELKKDVRKFLGLSAEKTTKQKRDKSKKHRDALEKASKGLATSVSPSSC